MKRESGGFIEEEWRKREEEEEEEEKIWRNARLVAREMLAKAYIGSQDRSFRCPLRFPKSPLLFTREFNYTPLGNLGPP